MSFVPMKSQTEQIIKPDAGMMEFNLKTEDGYLEWRRMFSALGVKASLFNGYMLQSAKGDPQISTTPVQLHLFPNEVYGTPPMNAREYYFRISQEQLQLGRLYFYLPSEIATGSLEEYMPSQESLYALDIWVAADTSETTDGQNQESLSDEDAEAQNQTIFTLIYEGHIKTQERTVDIERFSADQLFDN